MRTAEGFIYLIFGAIILFIVPLYIMSECGRFMANENGERVRREFESQIYEDGCITLESYSIAYENALLYSENGLKVRVYHLEGKRNAELSDYLYIDEDEDIRTMLHEGSYPILKGNMVQVYE